METLKETGCGRDPSKDLRLVRTRFDHWLLVILNVASFSMKKISHVDNVVLDRIYRSVVTDSQSKQILPPFGSTQSGNIRTGAGLKGIFLEVAHGSDDS